MNITKFATILLIIPCLISCYGNKSSKTTQSNNADYDIRLNDSIAAVNARLEEGNADGEKINAFLDAYISRHPNCFNNDIQRKKAGKELRSLLEKELENNPDFLSDIAVKFASMDKVKSTDNKGYKYLISFTCSSLQKTGKYNISFRIITALDEEEASNLIDNQKYYIQGKFISLSEKESINIRLDVFDDKTIEIGSIFIKEPIVTPAN